MQNVMEKLRGNRLIQEVVEEGSVSEKTWWCCKANYPNHEPTCKNANREGGSVSDNCYQTHCKFWDKRAEEYCNASDLESMEQMVKCPYFEKQSPDFDAALEKAAQNFKGDKIVPKKFTPKELKLLAEDEINADNAIEEALRWNKTKEEPDFDAALEKAMERFRNYNLWLDTNRATIDGFKSGFRAGFDAGRERK